MRAALAEKPEGFDPKLFLKPAREAVTALCCERIAVMGSGNKA
jgi:fructose/tagatose bisphosphate aldolase